MGWVTLTDGYPLPVAPPGLTDGKEYRIQDQKKMLVSGQKASLTTISFTAAKPSPRCTLLVKLTNKPIYITAYGDCYDPRDYPKVRAELESIVSSIKVETASPPNPQ